MFWERKYKIELPEGSRTADSARAFNLLSLSYYPQPMFLLTTKHRSSVALANCRSDHKGPGLTAAKLTTLTGSRGKANVQSVVQDRFQLF